MLRRRLVVAAPLAALVVAAMPPAARADKVIEAQVVWKYDAPEYTIEQGEKLVFKNSDTVSPGNHDVTADAYGPDGKTPVFRSATIDDGQEAVVDGAQQLAPGTYSFHCSIHTFMQAKLNVTPGKAAPPSSAPPASAQPADTTKPRVSAKLKATTLRRAASSRRVLATVTSSELTSLHLVLTARVRGRTVTLGQLTTTDGAPRRKVDFAVRLTSAGVRALRRARRLSIALAVHATDQAGNVTTIRTSRRLRR